MRITQHQLGRLFSILHDGIIQSYSLSSGKLTLRIKIRYLAQSIDPSFTTFQMELEGVIQDSQLKVVCNQPEPQHGYCGGELRLTASGAHVRDEDGTLYGLDELEELARLYWNEWSAKNRA